MSDIGPHLEEAWACGLFEGEGHIGVREADGHHGDRARLSLAMTDEDVVRRFAVWAECGSVYIDDSKQRLKPSYKVQWVWQTSAASDIQRLLTDMMPFLGLRRSEQAQNALLVVSRASTHRGRHKKDGSCCPHLEVTY